MVKQLINLQTYKLTNLQIKTLVCSLLAIFCCACKEMPNMGKPAVIIQPPMCTLYEGGTRQLYVSQDSVHTWLSEDTTVVTVSKTGLITAQTLPDTVIAKTVLVTAQVDERSASCTVTVLKAQE